MRRHRLVSDQDHPIRVRCIPRKFRIWSILSGSALSDPNLAAPSVASMLGLSVGSDDVRPGMMAYLHDKRILLILDTCEHLIDAVATLAAGIIAAAPKIHILATSREALRIEGERVYKLDALGCRPDDREMT